MSIIGPNSSWNLIADRVSSHERQAPDAVRIVLPALWPHLGARFDVAAPDLVLACVLCARRPLRPHMIPQVSAAAVREAMRWAADERRLAEACGAVFTFTQESGGWTQGSSGETDGEGLHY